MTPDQITNKENQDNEIQVVGESRPNVCTYSLSQLIYLTNKTRQYQPHTNFRGFDNLLVPYSTINTAKQARLEGAREALFIANERPDRSPEIRTTLDLWGFTSYINYLYTVTELAFLEGLIPVIDVGFLSPIELKQMTEICALFKLLLNQPDRFGAPFSETLSQKKHDIRLKSIEWSGKLEMPVLSGIYIGLGETKNTRKAWIQEIADLHKTFNHIHDFMITPLVFNTPPKKPDTSIEKTLLSTYELARSILPEDVSVNVPSYLIQDIKPFLNAGMRDLGSILLGPFPTLPHYAPFDFEKLQEDIHSCGLSLQQRFPLNQRYIQNNRYSNKLGQVFDAYKYKLKKHDQQMVKEKTQSTAHETAHTK